jgi:hypothetical protein
MKMDWEIIQSGSTSLSLRIEDKTLFFIIENSESAIIKTFDVWKDSVIDNDYQLIWLDGLRKINSQMQDDMKKILSSKNKIPKSKELYDQLILLKLDRSTELFPYWKPLKEIQAFIEIALDTLSSIYCFTD